MEYAGFWRRFAAWIIDLLVLAAGVLAAGFVIGVIVAISGGNRPSSFGTMIDVIALVGTYLYFAFMESSHYQGTIGKIAIGIKVTDLEGGRVSFGKALGRTLAKIISSLILFIGYFMAGFTARKQALHDIIASTLVIRRKPASGQVLPGG
jgi:uncharacterized RDD family membrane protein YckC